jgi:ribosome-binding protein aMBF1 (putative translation factor)
MTIDDYRIRFGWSRRWMAQEAGIDVNTLRSAMQGRAVYRAKIGQITEAINRELERRGQARITYTDLEGVIYAD